MKKTFIVMLAVLLLATGCTKELKESKKESRKAIKNTEKIEKNRLNPLTDSELAYMKTIEGFMENFHYKAIGISELMAQANDDPSIIKDEKWMKNLKNDFLEITISSSLMVTMADDNVVPDRFLNLHNNIQQTFELMSNAGDKLIQSFQNDLDMTLFNQSMELIRQSNNKFDEVNKELKEIKLEISAN